MNGNDSNDSDDPSNIQNDPPMVLNLESHREYEDEEEVNFLEKLMNASFMDGTNELLQKKLRAPVYTGDSKRTQERRTADEKIKQKVAKYCKKITDFFTKKNPESKEVETKGSIEKDEIGVKFDNKILQDLCTSLEGIIASSRNSAEIKIEKKSIRSHFDYVRLLCVSTYFELILGGASYVNASNTVAQTFIKLSKSHNSVDYFGKLIRRWARYYYSTGNLVGYEQGSHQKFSLLNDASIRSLCMSWLLEQKPWNRTAPKFANFVKNQFPKELEKYKIAFCEKTARNWLNSIGFKLGELGKGTYFDGHERLDVQIYRGKFLERMFNSYFPRMATYEGEGMERVPPTLSDDTKELILITHKYKFLKGVLFCATGLKKRPVCSCR